jgi:copper chaperone CopZ
MFDRKRPDSVSYLYKWFFLALFSIGALVLQGCLPVIEKSYKTPEVKGKLVFFMPDAQTLFEPAVMAKIYHKGHPETAVYSDEKGFFLLPAITKVEAKLLMMGHSYFNYPIIVETDLKRYLIFAETARSMRSLETADLDSIILETLDGINEHDTDVATKSAWPCNIELIHHLDQAIYTAQRLLDSSKDSVVDTGYMANHYGQTRRLQYEAKASCQWQEISDEAQFRHLSETREYFSNVDSILSVCRPSETQGYFSSADRVCHISETHE